MAHLTASVEYGMHCLLWLVGTGGAPVSSRDLAALQGISPTFLAKIFTRLEKAGIVRATEGVRGGYILARDAREISVLDIVDAIEGDKRLFDCQEIRGRCAVFGEQAPAWATAGTCSIHAVMLRAEEAMRQTLAGHSMADIAAAVGGKAPPAFAGDVRDWIDRRQKSRSRKPRGASTPG